MRIVLYNPPSTPAVIRRYMCSYNAGENLYPCVELLALAGLVRDRGHEAVYLDAVAEGLTSDQAKARLQHLAPSMVISLTGLECLHSDLAELTSVISALPDAEVGIMGYYPTLYPERCIREGFHFVLRGEPEPGLERLLAGESGPGLATATAIGEIAPRLTEDELNQLPVPAHDLIQPALYRELGLGRHLTAVQFTRGCPFACSYCIRSYGRKAVNRSPQRVLEELDMIHRLGIRKIRFLDDTFTCNSSWTKEICSGMIERNYGFTWGALSRVDTLDPETLSYMKRAGCSRMFIGIESGSQRILDYYKKGYKVDEIAPRVRRVREAGIQAIGFFLLGAPMEEDSDVALSIQMAKACDLDFVIATKLVVYPGIELESDLHAITHVDPWTGEHRFVSEAREQKILEWERMFYRQFYLSWRGIRTGIQTVLRDPLFALRAARGLLSFTSGSSGNGDHPDYL